MEKIKKNAALIAAILFAVVGVCLMIQRVDSIVSSYKEYLDYEYKDYYSSFFEFYNFPYFKIVEALVFIGLSVTLFIKNKKALVLSAGIIALVKFYWLAVFFSIFKSWWYYLGYYVLPFCVYAALVCIIILSFKGNAIAKKFWFLPGTLQSIYVLICMLTDMYWAYSYYYSGFEAFLSYLFTWYYFSDIAEIAALFLTGIWLKESFFPTKKVKKPTVNRNELIGGADKLKKYKELLDCGAITQEEFEARKKEILGI